MNESTIAQVESSPQGYARCIDEQNLFPAIASVLTSAKWEKYVPTHTAQAIGERVVDSLNNPEVLIGSSAASIARTLELRVPIPEGLP
jgi:hypothetical protein